MTVFDPNFDRGAAELGAYGGFVPPDVAMMAAMRELGLSTSPTNVRSSVLQRFGPAARTAYGLSQATGGGPTDPTQDASSFHNYLLDGIRNGSIGNQVQSGMNSFGSALQAARSAYQNDPQASTGNSYLDQMKGIVTQPQALLNMQNELLNPFLGSDQMRNIQRGQGQAMNNSYLDSALKGGDILEYLFGAPHLDPTVGGLPPAGLSPSSGNPNPQMTSSPVQNPVQGPLSQTPPDPTYTTGSAGSRGQAPGVPAPNSNFQYLPDRGQSTPEELIRQYMDARDYGVNPPTQPSTGGGMDARDYGVNPPIQGPSGPMSTYNPMSTGAQNAQVPAWIIRQHPELANLSPGALMAALSRLMSGVSMPGAPVMAGTGGRGPSSPVRQ